MIVVDWTQFELRSLLAGWRALEGERRLTGFVGRTKEDGLLTSENGASNVEARCSECYVIL